MAEIEKSKVHLNCQILKEAYCPGETLTGEVHLDVKKSVTFSALKLHLLGIEEIYGVISIGFNPQVNRDSLTYLNHWITFTSPTMNINGDETLTYDAGCYKFPFSVPLNSALPPSFNSANTHSYIRLVYTASAIFEIDKNHNVTSDAYFRIKSVVPHRQTVVHTNCAQRIDFEVPVYRHSFMGWVHGKQLDESVHLSARVDPCFISIGKRDGEGNVDKVPFTLRLSVRNSTLKVIKDIEVQIQQATNINYTMLESSEWTLLAHNYLRKVCIKSGEERDLAIEMKMSTVDFTKVKQRLAIPLPSFSTRFIMSNYIVVVNFPKNKFQRNISFHGLLNVLEEVSMFRHAVMVPYHHTPAGSTIEAQYLTYPVNFADLEDDMFVVEPQPYLPRPAQEQCVVFDPSVKDPYWNGQDSVNLSEREKVREREEMSVHMMGTPLPGHIIRGQVRLSPVIRSCSVFEAFRKGKKVKKVNKHTGILS
ncbi:unnamed protein product [Phytomonas sp. Hart1]|nr:unnamed protein product [Phytomonas sp. Hart1]|eukprot:CCW69762.1 unnamed protein product [Phytomonas sp. isolate Hart1]